MIGLAAENYITSSCVISNSRIVKNGVEQFATDITAIPDFLVAAYKQSGINYSRFYKMDNLGKLGWLAAELLLQDNQVKENYDPNDIGIVLSNSNASLDTDLRYMASVSDIPSPALFVYTLPNIVTGEICIRNGFKGENAFFVFNKFDAGFLSNYVGNLLDSNALNACICGWVDLVGNEYKAALFLVEKVKTDNAILLSADNMNKIFEGKNITPQVYIAGIGVISAIGNNVGGNLASLTQKQPGMGDITTLNTIYKNKRPVAEVKLSNQQLVEITGLHENASRTTLLSCMAAREALDDAAIPGLSSLRKGFVSANTVGGMDKSEDFFIEFLADNNKGKLRNIFDHECGSVTETVAEHLGLTDYLTTINTACSSSANAIFYGARLIKNDILDVVVAGGTDSLTKFTLNGFNTLMILDNEFCKPFDEHRKGLNLGEGAGYVVLVSERVARTLSKPVYCKLSGYNNSNDAYHQTASSPNGEGSYLAMKNALAKSGLAPSAIDYVNLHGTGTPNNDSAEGIAITRLFNGVYPPMSSTKSFTGHTLGASGGIEAVFSVLAIKHGLIFPNLRFETQMEELDFKPETELLENQDIKHVMSNSFGFGGNCTSLVFSRV